MHAPYKERGKQRNSKDAKEKDSVISKKSKVNSLKVLIKLTNLSWDKKKREFTDNIRIKRGNTVTDTAKV